MEYWPSGIISMYGSYLWGRFEWYYFRQPGVQSVLVHALHFNRFAAR